MDFVAYYTDYKTGQFRNIKNVSGRMQAKKTLTKYLQKEGIKKFRILYVMLPNELARIIWNKIHDQNTRLTDLHHAYGKYMGLHKDVLTRQRANNLAIKSFSRLPKHYRDMLTSMYLALWWPRTSEGKLANAIDGNVYK